MPSLVVLHFTGGQSFDYALTTLTGGRDRKVSSHYLIREDGQVFRLVPEEKRAWHAGRGSWKSVSDVNNVSIGIELSNRDRKPYPPAQLKALADLCRDLQARYNIPAAGVIGHADLAPERRDDPGYHFPWGEMAKLGIGVIPKTRLRDRFRAAATASNPRKLRRLFNRAGYGAYDLTALTRAFQQHYQPHVYTAPRRGEAPGKPNAEMVAQLRALARYNRKHPA